MNLEKLFTFLAEEGKIELSDAFKSKLQDTITVAIAEKDAEIEKGKGLLKEATDKVAAVEAELAKTKETIVEDVTKEVAAYKEALVEKMDSFFEAELKTLIPENLVESEAKLAIYEPIVEGFKATISGFGIKIDSEGHALLKDAKTSIVKLTEDYNAKVVEFKALEEASGKLLAKSVLTEKCVGLTTEQAAKINVIFAGKNVDEINEKFDSIRDLVITEKKEEKPVEKPVVTEQIDPSTVEVDAKKKELAQLAESCGVKYI
jgi:hypothetical protein